MPKEQFSFSEWREENQKLVDEMFRGNLLTTWDPKEVSFYIKQLTDFYIKETRRDFFTYHNLSEMVGEYLKQLGWEYRTEYSWENMFELDIVATKEEFTILVKVKPKPTMDDIEHVIDYANSISKKTKKARMFMATDILNLSKIFQGESQAMVIEAAEKYNLGIIFSNKNQSWILPSEFIQVLAKQ